MSSRYMTALSHQLIYFRHVGTYSPCCSLCLVIIALANRLTNGSTTVALSEDVAYSVLFSKMRMYEDRAKMLGYGGM